MSSAERRQLGQPSDRMCGFSKPKRDYMSSAERKTTGSTFMIGCVVKTKERLHEQRRKEDNWVNLHDRMCGKNQRETT